jgi:hypothetical protein
VSEGNGKRANAADELLLAARYCHLTEAGYSVTDALALAHRFDLDVDELRSAARRSLHPQHAGRNGGPRSPADASRA